MSDLNLLSITDETYQKIWKHDISRTQGKMTIGLLFDCFEDISNSFLLSGNCTVKYMSDDREICTLRYLFAADRPYSYLMPRIIVDPKFRKILKQLKQSAFNDDEELETY